MKLNITILVQAFNFYIAYTLITRFFLKPLLNAVYEENLQREELTASIENEEGHLSLKKDYFQKLWVACQREFNDRRPTIEKPREMALRKFSSIENEAPMSKAKLDQLTNEIANSLKVMITKHD